MKYIKFLKQFSDGRPLEFHKISEVSILNATQVVFKIGSYTYLESLISQATPEITSEILVNIPSDKTVDEVVNNFLEDLVLQPEWNGILVDESLSNIETLPEL